MIEWLCISTFSALYYAWGTRSAFLGDDYIDNCYQVCRGAYAFTYITFCLGAASQLVLCLRVYALWNKRWWMGLTMSICWVGSQTANIALVIVYLVSVFAHESRSGKLIEGSTVGCLAPVVEDEPSNHGLSPSTCRCLLRWDTNKYHLRGSSAYQGGFDETDHLQTIVIIATLVRVITALRSHCQDSPQKSLVRHIVHS